MSAKPNTIVLTSGLTGSSVLTGLIARAGYWVGDETNKKEDYDTNENRRLVELNRSLFAAAGYTGDYTTEYSPELIEQMECLHRRIDDSPYRSFVAECNEHSPWVWKDPRLWITIRFWRQYLHLEGCRFILLTRSHAQIWISGIARRQIRSYRDSREYESSVETTIRQFVQQSGVAALEISYEQLIATPGEAIGRLNEFLSTELTVDDLRGVYSNELFKVPRSSFAKSVKALLIYAKNYSERVDSFSGRRSRRV